jgi:hypothetical protein
MNRGIKDLLITLFAVGLVVLIVTAAAHSALHH